MEQQNNVDSPTSTEHARPPWSFLRLAKLCFKPLIDIGFGLARAFRGLAILTAVLFVGIIIAIPVTTWWSSNEVISDDAGVQRMVNDPETTYMVRYLGGCGPVPAEFELNLLRDRIRSEYLRVGDEPPENLHEYDMDALERLVATWVDKDGYRIPRAIFESAFADLQEAAVEAPVENPGDDTCDEIWADLEAVGYPKIRIVERQNDFTSMLIAAFAPRGREQAAYLPFMNTIYIRYEDSKEELYSEMPHSEQFREAPYESYGRWFMGIFRASRCLGPGALKGLQNGYQTEYDLPGSLEYEAHVDMEKHPVDGTGGLDTLPYAPAPPRTTATNSDCL